MNQVPFVVIAYTIEEAEDDFDVITLNGSENDSTYTRITTVPTTCINNNNNNATSNDTVSNMSPLLASKNTLPLLYFLLFGDHNRIHYC
jgi:hypothetical protein